MKCLIKHFIIVEETKIRLSKIDYNANNNANFCL